MNSKILEIRNFKTHWAITLVDIFGIRKTENVPIGEMNYEQIDRWFAEKPFVQECFTEASPHTRELFISGLNKKEFAEMFGGDK